MSNPFSITAQTGNGGTGVHYREMPDACPICHHAVSPTPYVAILLGSVNRFDSHIGILFQCTKRECRRFFIGRYNFGSGLYVLEESVPQTFLSPSFPKEIEEISPAFVKIYTQTAQAATMGLNEIVGVGYRKALEFLVKDYLIHENAADASAIKAEFLAVSIQTRVADANLKSCASRAAWLGNDETHYTRLWETKDVSDLRVLINLAMHWIRSSVLTKEYEKSMQK